MNIIIIVVAVTAGVILGGTAIYVYQGKCRQKELQLLADCMEKILREEKIREMAGCPVHMVAGNNDFFCDLPREDEFEIGRYRVLLTHGHYYYISMGTEMLKEEARARNFDIAMFGHTHRPYLEQERDVTVLNPGSMSYPRQEGRKPSYMVMEIDGNGDAAYTIKYI